MPVLLLIGAEVITPEERVEIETRLEHASPGPWRACYWPIPTETFFVTQVDRLPDGTINAFSSRSGPPVSGPIATEADSRFIAHARTDIPRLLAEVTALEERLDAECEQSEHGLEVIAKLREALRSVRDCPNTKEDGFCEECRFIAASALDAV